MRALSFFVFLGAARRSLKGLKSMLLEGSGGNRIPAGCAISSIFSRSAKCIAGDRIVKSISVMHFFFILLYVSVTSGHINSSYGFSSLYHRRGSFFYVRFYRTCSLCAGTFALQSTAVGRNVPIYFDIYCNGDKNMIYF